MTGAIAIGVGCRKGCPADAIQELVRRALSLVPSPAPLGLFSITDKRDELGLTEASKKLGLKLTYLDRDALKARIADVQTRSEKAEELFAVPSVAEAAALAGAGPSSVLIVPRIAADGATCAIARAAS